MKDLLIETQIKNELKILENKITLNSSSCSKFLRNNILFKEYCENILKENPEWKTIFNVIYYHIYLNKELNRCKACNKLIPFEIGRNRLYCSRKCCSSDENFIQQRVNKILSKPIEEQQKSKEKRRKTTLERYGGIGFQVNELQEKTIKTCYEKYGCKNPMQNKDVKEKAIRKLKEVLKLKNNGFRNKDAAQFYNKIINNWKEYIIPLFSKDEYENKSKIYKWKCVLCGNEFEQRIFTTHHLEDKIDQYIPRCLHCFPSTIGKSKPENDLFDFCKSYFPNLINHENKNVRTFIPNREIDILIPDIKLAIEFNGVKFHSIQGFREKQKESEYHNYHLNKTLECEKLGYRLIHIWDEDWNLNKEEIKKKLIDIFKGNENLIFNDLTIKLDRMWYSKLQKISNYELIEETKPEMVKIKKFDVENCGFLIYKRRN